MTILERCSDIVGLDGFICKNNVMQVNGSVLLYQKQIKERTSKIKTIAIYPEIITTGSDGKCVCDMYQHHCL